MSTCRWLQETEKQVVKMRIANTLQNPSGDQNMEFEVFITKLPGDELGFHYPTSKSDADTWMAQVVWEIQDGKFDGHLIIEVLQNAGAGDGLKFDLPYTDETTGLRFWQVALEMDEESVEMIDPAFKLNEQDMQTGVDIVKGLYEPADRTPCPDCGRVGGHFCDFGADKLHQAEEREHRHSDPMRSHFEDRDS